MSAPSVARKLSRLMATRTYTEIEVSSMPRYSVMRSPVAPSKSMPTVANRMSAVSSAKGTSFDCAKASTTLRAAIAMKSTLKKTAYPSVSTMPPNAVAPSERTTMLTRIATMLPTTTRPIRPRWVRRPPNASTMRTHAATTVMIISGSMLMRSSVCTGSVLTRAPQSGLF